MTQKKPPKPTTYEVTLRRDVQQVARVSVYACSLQEARDVAESIVGNAAWALEEHIGSHSPQIRKMPHAPGQDRVN